MPAQGDIDQQLVMLRIYRRTLGIFLQQRAMQSTAFVQPATIFGIEEAREHIQHIKGWLRAWSVEVEDLPDDAELAAPPPAIAPAPPPPVADQPSLARELLDTLDVARAAFDAQIQLRDPLVQLVRRRLAITHYYEYEEFFERYFGQLNDEERYIHQKIRVQTRTMQMANERSAAIAAQLTIEAQAPALPQLRRHLAAWLAKYERVFKHTPHICLVYVGVEERIPFPYQVEAQLRAYLAGA